MRMTAIVLASVVALSSTVAMAHSYKHHGMRHSYNSYSRGGSNPNGTPGGRTSLSGTGSSQFGGSVPGTSGHN